MTRPAKISINSNNIIQNCKLARQLHGGKLLAVVKANAYGHGDLLVARQLAEYVEGFAVACLEEAVVLREGGITHPIVLLEGPFSALEIPDYLHYQLTPVIHHIDQYAWWSEATSSQGIWLKFDTGMHRLGFQEKEINELFRNNKAQNSIRIDVLMTHFANADSIDPQLVHLPMERFKRVLSEMGIEGSIANSAAIMLHSQLRSNWARPGLMLYGVDPLGRAASEVGLKPVMKLTSEVIALRWIDVGESVGYGSTFTASQPTRVATIACGYADGYPRTAKNGTPVWINGKKLPLIGRVSMDMITVDVTQQADVQLGSQVELWGDNINVAEVAHCSGTLAYELLCHTHRPARINS
ncbi:alanine racemase [Ferrovum sp. PN-J185]|uniref:alanine racemase n=1 Tax=Ferrovum sp. PN-J185 TaxID=1356306 RepID=UPI001E595149|nr:alanine racemase [Ferrovum sp. PN-J185]MCC6068587.1 alanine racemase [Ferrovum sp. PN-J185]